MKTVKEWLNELPEPYRTQAIENCMTSYPYTGGSTTDNLWYALSAAFKWKNTPQGDDYWFNLSLRIL